jgi:hypothetical protein
MDDKYMLKRILESKIIGKRPARKPRKICVTAVD